MVIESTSYGVDARDMTSQPQPLSRPILQSPEEEDTDPVVRAFPQRSPRVEEPSEAPDATFRVWEYKTALGGAGAKDANAVLNTLGADGWELAGVEPPQPGGQTILYLKRPKRA